MPTRVWTLRMAALMGGGTFAVHQLRYALSYGHDVGGHGYLDAVGPVVVAALLLAFATLLGRIARGVEETAPRFRRLWVGTTVALVAVYCAQESIEGLVSGRVPGALEHGGWFTLPLAVAVGLLIALVMRGASAATRLPTPGAAPRSSIAADPLRVVLPPWVPAATRATARHRAARGPPAVA